MCSSYTTKSKTNKEEYKTAYGLPWDESDAANEDAYTDESGEQSVGFPGNKMPVITIGKPNVIQDYEFGFIAGWVGFDKLKDIKNTHNARIETITELATWRDAWKKKQRCLVCTTGFYEYDKKHRKKVHIHLKDNGHFYFAGIYNDWVNKSTGEIKRTMAVITTTPNDLVATVHHRMPVIIIPGNEKQWMDPDAETDHLLLQYSQPLNSNFMVMEDVEVKPKTNQGGLFG